MSILSQIAPRDPGGLMSIDIASTATATSLPHVPIGAEPVTGRLADATAISRALLVGIGADVRAAEALEARLDEYVDVWTPALHATARFELISLMVDLDDAIGDVAVAFTECAATDAVAMLGWQVTARFVRPAYLDDDHLLEPTGAVINVAGATSVAFSATGRAERIRCYYDRLALVEQIVPQRRDRSTP